MNTNDDINDINDTDYDINDTDDDLNDTDDDINDTDDDINDTDDDIIHANDGLIFTNHDIKYKNNQLIEACKLNNIEYVKFSLAYGADINYENNEGDTPLICACESNRLNVVKYFVKHGANVNAKTKTCMAPIVAAFTNLKILKYLLKHGAILDIDGDENSYSTLCYIGYYKIIVFVINYMLKHYYNDFIKIIHKTEEYLEVNEFLSKRKKLKIVNEYIPMLMRNNAIYNQ